MSVHVPCYDVFGAKRPSIFPSGRNSHETAMSARGDGGGGWLVKFEKNGTIYGQQSTFVRDHTHFVDGTIIGEGVACSKIGLVDLHAGNDIS